MLLFLIVCLFISLLLPKCDLVLPGNIGGNWKKETDLKEREREEKTKTKNKKQKTIRKINVIKKKVIRVCSGYFPQETRWY